MSRLVYVILSLARSRHATLLSISAVEAKEEEDRFLSFSGGSSVVSSEAALASDNACMPSQEKGLLLSIQHGGGRTINKKK